MSDKNFSNFFEDETTEENRNSNDSFFVSYQKEKNDEQVKEFKPSNTHNCDSKKGKSTTCVKQNSSEKRKAKKYTTVRNSLVTIIWVVAVVGISVAISVFALSSINDLVGFSKESYEAEVSIPEGSSLSEIADILKENGIIDEPFAFEVYATIKHKAESLAAGKYILNSNLGYDQIFLKMKPATVATETISLTFYEGMTASEIAQKLSDNKVCSYDEFMNAVDNEVFDYDFVTQMSDNEYIYHKWEGYLFPDTYEFYIGSSGRAVLSKFVGNFNNKISAYEEKMADLGLKLCDVISLASVIQSEAASQNDMYNVSSVFHNRLKEGSGFGYLQSDVTYFYYRDEIEPFVKEDATLDEKYHTSYDTYYKSGCPVGPICNPGLDAIEAVLYPADTNYYYFVTDLSGNFYYASSLAQHEVNIAKAGRTGGKPQGDN